MVRAVDTAWDGTHFVGFAMRTDRRGSWNGRTLAVAVLALSVAAGTLVSPAAIRPAAADDAARLDAPTEVAAMTGFSATDVPADQAAETLLERGRELLDEDRPAEAAAAFARVAAVRPARAHTPIALHLLNRALMAEERAAGERYGRTGAPTEIDHSDAIAVNLGRLYAAGAAEEVLADALLDAIRYHAERVRWNLASAPLARPRVLALVELMEELVPYMPQMQRAQLKGAWAIEGEDVSAAMVIVDDVIAAAITDGDEALYIDAVFHLARLHTANCDLHLARELYDALAQLALTPARRGQVALFRALSYWHEDLDRCAAELAAVSDDPTYTEDVGAAALVTRAEVALVREDLSACLALLDEAERRFPDNLSTTAIQGMRAHIAAIEEMKRTAERER